MEDKTVIMPRGTHVNKEMSEIPSDYLKWVILTWDDEEVVEAADEEYQRREAEYDHWYND